MTALHKVSFIVPSDKRLELEKMVEELMAGVEGFTHQGSFAYDPNKPQVVYRTAKPKAEANGHVGLGPDVKPRRDTTAECYAIMVKERRPFSTMELAQRLGIPNGVISQTLGRLAAKGKARIVARGVYIVI